MYSVHTARMSCTSPYVVSGAYCIIACAHSDCHVQGRLHGIITCEHGKLETLKTESVAWGPDIKKMLALCNDLVPLKKGQLVGSLDEKKAFAAVEAAFMVSNLAHACSCCLSPISVSTMLDNAGNTKVRTYADAPVSLTETRP